MVKRVLRCTHCKHMCEMINTVMNAIKIVLALYTFTDTPCVLMDLLLKSVNEDFILLECK